MTNLFTAILEQAICRYLQLDPETLQRLAALSGKVVKVELNGWNIIFYLFPDQDGLRLQNYYEGPVDATIKGAPLTLLRLGFVSTAQAATLANEIDMSGDIELARTISHILQQCQVDWEEPLSRVVGDTVAHQISHTLRKVKRWGKRTFTSMSLNMTEYLQEEARYLPGKQEVEDFFTDNHALNHDVERFAQKLRQYKRTLI